MNIDDIILSHPLNLISGFFIIFLLLILSFKISNRYSLTNSSYLNLSINYILVIIFFSKLVLFFSLLGFQVNVLRIVIICIFVISLLRFNYNFNLSKLVINKKYILILLIFFCLSLLPPLDADSLDYHLSGPIHILRNEKFIIPSDFYWLHFRLVGSGEMTTLLGLIFGSDSFGQVIQFSGLIIILINFHYLSQKFKVNFNYFIFILSLPVLLSLISTHKPFLFQSSLILTSLILCYEIYKKYSLIKSLLVVILLSFSIASKISFVIQALPIFLYVFYLSTKNYKFRLFFSYFVLISLILIAPNFLKNYLIWSEPFTPFYHFQDHINKEYIDSWLYALVTGEYLVLFPENVLTSIKNLIIPFKPAEYSQVLGVGLLSFIFLLKKDIFNNIIKDEFQFFLFCNLIFVFLSLIYIGKGRPRFYLEIYYILGIFLCINNRKILKSYKYLEFILIIQLSLNLFAAIISIYLFLPGSLHPQLYKKIMNKYSYQYEISNWINKNTEDDTKFVYNDLRSRHAIKRNFTSYFARNGDFENFMKRNNINYVVFNEELKELYDYNSACLNFIDKKVFEQNTKNFLRPPWKIELEIYQNNCN